MELIQSMYKYISTHLDDVAICIGEHIYLVLVSVSISVVFATALVLLCRRFKRFGKIVFAGFNLAYTIPSMSLLALLMPIFGLGAPTAIACIVIYEQYLLLKNVLIALESVDPAIIEAGKGMGMNPTQLFFRVHLPQALPTIVNSLKLAFLSAIGLAVLGAFISAGGIGTLIYDGLRRNYTAKVVWGTLFTTTMAIITNQIFQKLERMALIKARGGFIRVPKGEREYAD